MSLIFDREAEEVFLNKPVIYKIAELITNEAKSFYSNRHYKGRSYRLRVRWFDLNTFRAAAYVSGNGDHEIRLTHGTAYEIYRDAFVLPEICNRILIKSEFDLIFNLVSYGNKREDVLPAGLAPLDAKVEIIRLMTTWLYLHEQAHHLQRHRDIAMSEGISELLSNEGEIVDTVNEEKVLKGRDAAMRHAFEFAADYEAITLLMLRETTHEMSESTIWCLAAGLMCMFQRFYDESPSVMNDVAQGSHPHPAVRMRMMISKISELFNIPEVISATKWTKGPEYARAIMDHAVYTADAYWHLRYLGLKADSPVLESMVSSRGVSPIYQEEIYQAWQSVRSAIVKGHLGHGEPVVMFLKGSKSVG